MLGKQLVKVNPLVIIVVLEISKYSICIGWPLRLSYLVTFDFISTNVDYVFDFLSPPLVFLRLFWISITQNRSTKVTLMVENNQIPQSINPSLPFVSNARAIVDDSYLEYLLYRNR